MLLSFSFNSFIGETDQMNLQHNYTSNNSYKNKEKPVVYEGF